MKVDTDCFLFTYTHSSCIDLWNMYFDSIDSHFPLVKSVVACNTISEEFKNHTFRLYDESKNYCQEVVRVLESCKEEYFIYMQEDFILYGDVDKESLSNYINLMDDTNLSFIRLIKCGDVSDYRIFQNSDLFWTSPPPMKHRSINSFSMQPTIWKKSKFIEMYKKVNLPQFKEDDFSYPTAMNDLGIQGAYCYRGEAKRKGSMHYDSSVFPYTATAIVKKKWNMSQYGNELEPLHIKYGIDVSIRGTR